MFVKLNDIGFSLEIRNCASPFIKVRNDAFSVSEVRVSLNSIKINNDIRL